MELIPGVVAPSCTSARCFSRGTPRPTVIGLVLYHVIALLEPLAIPWHVSRRGPLGAEGEP